MLPGVLGLALSIGVTGCSDVKHANAHIAFLGDSITAFWSLPASNLGVPGDTAGQMLARFPGELARHSFKAVVILGGTNDVRPGTHPLAGAVSTAIANLTEIGAQAQAAHLTVVICTIPPLRGEEARAQAMNVAIVNLAQTQHYKLVDYYTPMSGHPEYFRDGVHPNSAGYAVMKAALAQVLPLDY